MSWSLRFTPDGQALIGRIGHMPETMGQQAGRAMTLSLALLEREVARRTPVSTGLLRGSIFSAQQGQPVRWHRGVVGTPNKYAPYVEAGRRPGRMPPVAVLARWAQLKLGDSRLGYVVARAIARRGTKGAHMFKNAARDNLARVQGFWTDVLGITIKLTVRR